MKIAILTVGKSKEVWIEEGFADYQMRLPFPLSLVLAKDDAQLITLAKKERLSVGLDPGGKVLSSPEFADKLYQWLEQGGARLTFVIGGPDGLPEELKRTLPLISLSAMTFTHQMARLILAEQIYRAAEIRRGSPYHR